MANQPITVKPVKKFKSITTRQKLLHFNLEIWKGSRYKGEIITNSTKKVRYIPTKPSTTFADKRDSIISDKKEWGNMIDKSLPDARAAIEKTKEYTTR